MFYLQVMSDTVVDNEENYAPHKVDARKHICQGRLLHTSSKWECITRECNQLCRLKNNVKHFLKHLDYMTFQTESRRQALEGVKEGLDEALFLHNTR
jgi:hypothetical protein